MGKTSHLKTKQQHSFANKAGLVSSTRGPKPGVLKLVMLSLEPTLLQIKVQRTQSWIPTQHPFFR